ncbi:MAG: NAD(P)/FAD-dependent oxidoreductase [Syntrophaceae bacterium]
MNAKRSGRTNSTNPDYDVIVIGTGMGGSAAGAISALNGLKTLILEKNPTPGGSCSYYKKQGFHVDTGTHLFIRGNKGPFGVCTRRLGLGEPLRFLHTDPITHLRGFNIDLAFPASWLRAPLALLQFIYQADIPLSEYPAISRMFKDILTMKPARIDELSTVSIEAFIQSYTHNPQVLTLIGYLMGLYFILPAWEASAGESIWNIQHMIKDLNLGYPKGGCVTIPMTFLKGARNHGAELRLKAGVKRIEVEKGRVRGVELENGEKVSARAVISTSSLKDTVFKLTGEEFFPAAYREKIRSVMPSMTATQAKIGVRKKLIKAGSLVGGWPIKMSRHLNEDQMKKNYHVIETGHVGELVPVYVPVPSNYDPELAPEGQQILTVVAVAPTLETDYIDPEQVWVERMMDAIHNLVPGLKENTIFCDRWSVTTLAGWIGKDSGSAITTGQSTSQVGLMRPPHETPVAGLFMAGDCAGPARGVGTELACQSGMDCADLVARNLSLGILN